MLPTGRALVLGLVAGLGLPLAAAPWPAAAQTPDPPAAIGRWDLVVSGPGGPYPSWLEVTPSGRNVLVGRWVGRAGSARPIGRIRYQDGVLHFVIPPQWEAGDADVRVEARVEPDRLTGTVTTPDGRRSDFTAARAPALLRAEPAWGQPIALFNGRDLTGWTPQGGGESHWVVEDGVLRNTSPGANVMTARRFEDFKLHLEFRYPEGGNSGVYLRGRHEVQVEDSPERDWPQVHDIGAIYGFLSPGRFAATGPGEWQTYDITLVGRRVTVVLNGTPILVDQVIPGITGGAIDSRESDPGPILLQGDHTVVEYRNIMLTPPAEGPPE